MRLLDERLEQPDSIDGIYTAEDLERLPHDARYELIRRRSTDAQCRRYSVWRRCATWLYATASSSFSGGRKLITKNGCLEQAKNCRRSQKIVFAYILVFKMAIALVQELATMWYEIAQAAYKYVRGDFLQPVQSLVP